MGLTALLLRLCLHDCRARRYQKPHAAQLPARPTAAALPQPAENTTCRKTHRAPQTLGDPAFNRIPGFTRFPIRHLFLGLGEGHPHGHCMSPAVVDSAQGAHTPVPGGGVLCFGGLAAGSAHLLLQLAAITAGVWLREPEGIAA